jgi:hypothetical protein
MSFDPARTAYLAATLAKRFPDCVPHMMAVAIVRLQRMALSAKAAAAKQCNVPMSEAEIDRADKRIANRAARIEAELMAACDAPADTLAVVAGGGDPRGPCAFLRIRGTDGAWMRGDGWDSGRGFPIY